MCEPERRATSLKKYSKPGIIRILSLPFLIVLILGWSTSACGTKEDVQPESSAENNFSPRQVVGIGRIEPELRFLDISSETTGTVTRINYGPGDLVEAGEVIVELSTVLEKARVDQAIARIRSGRSRIEAAEAALSAVKVRTENARLSFERAKELYEGSTESKAVYDEARAEFEALQEDVKRFQAELVTAGNTLKEYQADPRLVQAELDRRFIRAPADGQLLSLDVTLGSLVSPDMVFAGFAPASPRVARCEIDELFAVLVRIGQKASIRNQGMTDVLAQGKVTFVAPSLTRKSLFSDEVGDLEDRRVREVWVTLDPGSKLLYGSRIECVIDLVD